MEEFFGSRTVAEDSRLQQIARTPGNPKWESTRQWFEEDPRCLVVNVDLRPSFGFRQLQEYLPQHCKVQCILIGQNPKVRRLAGPGDNIAVGPMTENDAINMFKKLAELPGGMITAAVNTLVREIVEELDRSPFYISFAAGYLRASQLNQVGASGLEQLLRKIRVQKDSVARVSTETSVIGNSDAIWHIAYDTIKGTEPSGSDPGNSGSLLLLNFFAFLDGYDIRSLL